MGIKTQSDYNSKVLHNVRRLMVNNTEVFRLINQQSNTSAGTLMYAKGKINFDYNYPLDGNNQTIKVYFFRSGDPAYDSVYAFYGDGFYYKTSSSSQDSFSKWDKQTLSEIRYPYGTQVQNVNEYNSPPIATFLGWYTQRTGGTQINTIGQVKSNTNLFDYKTSSSLPEITLYAHWKVATYNITVYNITRSCSGVQSKSSFEYNGTRTTGTVVLKNVLWGTKVKAYLNSHIKNPQYISWAAQDASNLFTSSTVQTTFRKGVQAFLGWATPYETSQYHNYIGRRYPNGSLGSIYYLYNGVYYHWGTNTHPNNYDGLLFDNTILCKNIEVYPQFQILVVYSKTKLPTGNTFGGTYSLYSKPVDWWDYQAANGDAPGLGLAIDSSSYRYGSKYYEWDKNKVDFSTGMTYAPYSSTIVLRFIES